MKSIYLYVVMLFMVATSACSKDPIFPDPGIDNATDMIDTVRRDTMDVYHLKMNINAPNGVKSIQILDGHTYKEIDNLSAQYSGQKKFVMDYAIDISKIEEETKLSYVVNIIDNDMRTFNRGFSLLVKGKSFPLVKFATDGEVLGVVSSSFDFKAKFETGINTIKRYKIIFDGQVLDEKNIENENLSDLNYSLLCNLSMIKDKDYTLSVELEDSKSQKSVTSTIVKLIEAKLPKQVIFTGVNGSSKQYFFNYNSDKSINYIDEEAYAKVVVDGYEVLVLRTSRIDFTYDEKSRLVRYSSIRTDQDGAIPTGFTVKYIDDKIAEICDLDENYVVNNVINITYQPNGTVNEFSVGTNPKKIGEVSYIKDFGSDTYLINEWWNTGTIRYQNFETIPVLIPTYIPSFPFRTASGRTTTDIGDLFMYKYVSKVTDRKIPDPKYKPLAVRTYMQDKNGQLKTLSIRESSGTIRKYEFIY